MDQQPFDDGIVDDRPKMVSGSLAENLEQRVPSVLVLDVSASMAGDPFRRLNEGLKAYKDQLDQDSLAKKRVEIKIITFGSEVQTVVNWTTADDFFPPTLEPSGLTYMGEAVNQAIDSIEARKQEYKANGIQYYRPWLFLISDGAPNDSNWETAAQRAVEAENANKLAMFVVGVEGADMDILNKFSNGTPLKLKGLDFRTLFQWLSDSQKEVSRSKPGDEVSLQNPTAPDGWATII